MMWPPTADGWERMASTIRRDAKAFRSGRPTPRPILRYPEIMSDWERTYALLLEEASRPRILNAAAQIQARNSRISFSGFAESARWLAADLENRGLEAADDCYPADGKTKIAGRVMPLAWDVEDGELQLVEPDGTTELLTSYRRRPYSVVMYSAPTDGLVEAPLVLFEPKQPRSYLGWQEEDFTGLPIEGSCVFFEVRPDSLLLGKLREHGAVGFILEGNGTNSAHHRHERDAVRWVNDAFGEGMVTRRSATLPGFSVSPNQGAEIRRRLEAGESLRARFFVRSSTHDGEFHFVRGALPGAHEPHRRIFLLAHLFEPNATNNCSGVAIHAEALSALKRLIDRGQLSPTARTIELFSSWELWGPAAYAAKNPEVRANGMAGLCIECLIRKDSPTGREAITLDTTHDSSPSYLNALLNVLLTHFAEQTGVPWQERQGFTGNDNVLTDPTLGPPTAILSGEQQTADGSYHTDADTVDRLDPERAAHVAALVGTTAYLLATASTNEARWLADLAYRRARRRIGDVADRAIDGSCDCGAERLTLLSEIEKQSIASVRQISQDQAVQDRVGLLQRSLDSVTELEAERVSAGCEGQTEPEIDSRLWQEAAAMVPVRTMPGPLALQNVAEDVRREFLREMGSPIASMEWYGGTPDLFWVDGTRNLAEICKLTQLSRPALYRDDALESMMKLYRFLERHGLMQIVLPAAETH